MTQRVDAAGTWVWTYQGDSSRVLSETLTPPSLPSRPSVEYAYATDTYELASVRGALGGALGSRLYYLQMVVALHDGEQIILVHVQATASR